MFKFWLCCLAVYLFLAGCTDSRYNQPHRRVHIVDKDGKYTLFKDGKQFHVKGASGSANLHLLKEYGGNAIRVWDTTHLAAVLDSAQANGIAVIVGLPFSNSNNTSLYHNPSQIAAQHKAFKSLIKRYKSNPAILMWCVGNELDFPYHWSYNAFYKAFNAMTDMIHEEDPDHPVTTTILNFNKKYIANLLIRCDIDLFSFNLFGQLYLLREDLTYFSWLWRGPFMVLEWGIDGPWAGTEYTAWSAYIEKSSKEKADVYLNRYNEYMPLENSRFLGSFVFFWGHKQETTHTWFSIFDREGAKSEAVSVLKNIWTGKALNENFPAVNQMLINKRNAKDNIILSSSVSANAEIIFFQNRDSIKTIRWELYKEDWYKKNNNENSTEFLNPLPNLIYPESGLKATFRTPAAEGPYRLFAIVYDYNGNFAPAIHPFMC